MCSIHDLAHITEERDEHDREVQQFVEEQEQERPAISPWAQRNLDGAQYAQPRGSQYEG